MYHNAKHTNESHNPNNGSFIVSSIRHGAFNGLHSPLHTSPATPHLTAHQMKRTLNTSFISCILIFYLPLTSPNFNLPAAHLRTNQQHAQCPLHLRSTASLWTSTALYLRLPRIQVLQAPSLIRTVTRASSLMGPRITHTLLT